MAVPNNPYRDRLARHLREHRPSQYQAMKESGELEKYINEVGDEIDEAVEHYRQEYLRLHPVPEGDFLKAAQHLNHAKLIAEEVMLREYLPMDEEMESEIGPSGGYED